MPGPLKPGNFLDDDITDYSSFVGSMADEMDKALSALMTTDGLPELNMDPNDQDVRHRRRLFVAIARGLTTHLIDRQDAFKITLPGGTVVTPEIDGDLS
jgi:hypothetical protein